jgi:hypothetical protein
VKLLKLHRRIRFHLAGRLGNQLFEWAFAHRALQRETTYIQFTTDRFHHPRGLAEYELEKLECEHIIAPKVATQFGLVLAVLDKLGEKARPLVHFLAPKLIREIDQDSSSIEISEKTNYISGFYIDKKYVEDVEEVVTKEICNTLGKIFHKRLSGELPKDYEVLHIRKGDFSLHQETYGILKDEYYCDIHKSDLPLIVVTELAGESRELIDLLKPYKVYDSSNSSAWEALAIMSHAQILHLSNSTLSWWAGVAGKAFGNKVTIPIPFHKNLSIQESNMKFLLHGFEARQSTFI